MSGAPTGVSGPRGAGGARGVGGGGAGAGAGAPPGAAAFGVLADAFDSFAEAAVLVCVPAVVLPALYLMLPETRGLELEESAPEP
jgi:hypothetical protein